MGELNINKQLTIDATAQEISPERANRNATRRSIIVINTSTGGQVITIAVDAPAVSKQGITLYPGGLWSDNADGGYLPTQKQITAISDLAGGLLSIQERVTSQ